MDSSQASLNTTQTLMRKLRFKELLDKGKRLESQINEQSSKETLDRIHQLIIQSDDISAEGDCKTQAGNPSEVVLDVQVVKMNNELVAKVFQLNSEFNERLYRNEIMGLVTNDDDTKWLNLTKLVCQIAGTVRAKPSLLGACHSDYQARVPKERQQRKRTILAAEKRPETVGKLQREDKGAQQLQIVQTQLGELFKANNRQPLPYYKLIIDPDNFMNTVENAFQMAFLARDNLIGIETGEDNYPQVRLTTSIEKKAQLDGQQAICTLNLELCQDMILFYDIKEPMLKTSQFAET